MIGWIALAGLIVRNSILLIDATIARVGKGQPLREAVMDATKMRTRPIMITALALVLGSMVILTDPTFQGMAISLLFGVFVSTLLTLLVIPMGCISLGQRIFVCASSNDPNACKNYDEQQANGNGIQLDQTIPNTETEIETASMTEVDFDVSTPDTDATEPSSDIDSKKSEVKTEETKADTDAETKEAEAKPVVKKKSTVKKKASVKKKSAAKKATKKKAAVKKPAPSDDKPSSDDEGSNKKA